MLTKGQVKNSDARSQPRLRMTGSPYVPWPIYIADTAQDARHFRRQGYGHVITVDHARDWYGLKV